MTAAPSLLTSLAAMIQWLSRAVTDMSGGDRLSYSTIGHIIDRLRNIKFRIAGIAERVRLGTYAPRRTGPRRASVRKPRTPPTLPTNFGWLLAMVPVAITARGTLEILLALPEMEALIAAAPGALGRPIRSLCWMLRLPPPDNLAPLKRPRPPKPAKPAKPAKLRQPPEQRPALPPLPAWHPCAPSPARFHLRLPRAGPRFSG